MALKLHCDRCDRILHKDPKECELKRYEGFEITIKTQYQLCNICISKIIESGTDVYPSEEQSDLSEQKIEEAPPVSLGQLIDDNVIHSYVNTNCREWLRRNNKPYPRSGCTSCGSVLVKNWSCPNKEWIESTKIYEIQYLNFVSKVTIYKVLAPNETAARSFFAKEHPDVEILTVKEKES